MGPLDLNSDKVEELSWKTRSFFSRGSTASATVPQWAAPSSISRSDWEPIYLNAGSIWRLAVALRVVFAFSHTT